MYPNVTDPIYQQLHPTEQQTMIDDIRFLKHLASGTDEQSPWHLVVDHTSDLLTSVPVVRIRAYRGDTEADEPVVDLTISLQSSYPLSGEPDYASFVKYRQARLRDAVRLLRTLSLANQDESLEGTPRP